MRVAKVADPMLSNGEVVYGTPLHRLCDAVEKAEAPLLYPLAGDISDVCKLCDSKDKLVAEMVEMSAVRPTEILAVKTDELRQLVSKAKKGAA